MNLPISHEKSGETAPDSVRYDRFQPRHIPEAAVFHAQNLSGDLTGMGVPFIRCFYDTALQLDGTFGWVAIRGQNIIGFVFGSVFGESLPGLVARRHMLRMISYAALSVLKRPLHALRVTLGLMRGSCGHSRSQRPELHFIAVSSSERGQRVGDSLFERFRHDMHARGHAAFELSVGTDLIAAIRFYEAHGGRVLYDYNTATQRLRRYLFQ
ncbi:MAG: GNAT family N-acetyltransferase [bacterium]